MCILIPKTDKATVELVREAVAAAEEKGKTTKWGGKLSAKRGNPLRDGDEEDKGSEYEGMYFVNASTSCKNKPGVRVLEGGKVVEALGTEDFYSGCWGAVTVNFFPYDSSGNKGVGAGHGYISNLPSNLETIQEIGYKNVLISTDGGQVENPHWELAEEEYLQYMLDHGIPEEHIRYMSHDLPSYLLGIEA